MKKNLKKKIIALLAVMTLVISMGTTFTYAATPDSSGNVFSANELGTINCAKDYYWAGDSLLAENSQIGYDAIVAGRNISFTLAKVGGSIRAAGQQINLNDVTVAHNITVAGQDINVSSGSSMEGAYIAGQTIRFEGTATGLAVFGQDVVIDGKINGNVSVYADTVTFGEDAVVTGIVTGTLGKEPTVAAGADVKNVNVDIDTSKDNEDVAAAALAGFAVGAKLFSLFSALVLGVLFCLVFKRPLKAAGTMLKEHPVAMPVTGFVSLFAVPIACILLLITIIGIPVSFLVFVLYVIILAISTAFAGASAGQLLFPKWNRWGSCMLGVAVVAVASAIPFLGVLVNLAAGIYTLGYFVLLAFYEMTSKTKQIQE